MIGERNDLQKNISRRAHIIPEYLKHPKDPLIAPLAFDYDEKRKDFNSVKMKTPAGVVMATKEEWAFKAPNMNDNNYNISIGRSLMQSLPFIDLKEVVGMKPDQFVAFANAKHEKWTLELPRMPTIYVQEWIDGETTYSMENKPGLSYKVIAKIENYIVTDIPQEKVPDKKQMLEDLFKKIIEVAFT